MEATFKDYLEALKAENTFAYKLFMEMLTKNDELWFHFCYESNEHDDSLIDFLYNFVHSESEELWHAVENRVKYKMLVLQVNNEMQEDISPLEQHQRDMATIYSERTIASNMAQERYDLWYNEY